MPGHPGLPAQAPALGRWASRASDVRSFSKHFPRVYWVPGTGHGIECSTVFRIGTAYHRKGSATTAIIIIENFDIFEPSPHALFMSFNNPWLIYCPYLTGTTEGSKKSDKFPRWHHKLSSAAWIPILAYKCTKSLSLGKSISTTLNGLSPYFGSSLWALGQVIFYLFALVLPSEREKNH